MPVATLTSKGQLTIPKEIRDYLTIDNGDKVEFFINEDGHVIMAAKTLDIDDIFGKFIRKKNIRATDINESAKNIIKKKNITL